LPILANVGQKLSFQRMSRKNLLQYCCDYCKNYAEKCSASMNMDITRETKRAGRTWWSGFSKRNKNVAINSHVKLFCSWGAGFEQGGGAQIYILLRAILEGNVFVNKPEIL
jgi:hypothetical protein